MSSADLQHVPLGVPASNPPQDKIAATDYYEILRVGPHADEDTIERVYRTLADRFHPDNPSTGDQDTFLRLREAYETLSDRAERARYNVMCRDANGSTRFRLRGREFFDGVRGGQNRRLAVLCLLYRQRIRTQDSPGLSILDLEQLTGCTREEVTSALWYLCEKKWATIGEFTTYSITAEGFDFVERKLEDRMEFRSLATWSYYDFPVEPEGPASKAGALPLDIEPAISQIAGNGRHGPRAAGEGEVFIHDHYEILGIGPRADEEVIERVYSTLAARFHPDNPSTGDARTFLRIREAYETLSDQAKRVAYDAVRDRTKHSERFRLRGREFFDGIKGEQLRRLAVLCLLYRQAAGELPGLTVLDLEQLTGCTREELGSALWYLREKKWAKYGDFTEYTITAAGFDVVENKLDEREAARSRAWLVPEDGRGQKVIAVAPRALIASADVPENRNSYVEVAPATFEQAPSIAEEFARLEVGAEAEAQSELSLPVTLPALMTSAGETPENLNSPQVGGGDQTEIKPSHVMVEVSEAQAPIEDAARIAKEFARLEAGAEGSSETPVASMSARNLDAEDWTDARDEQPADAPEFASPGVTAQIAEESARLEAGATNIQAEEPPDQWDEQADATPTPGAIEEAARIAKAFARLEAASQAVAARIGATHVQAEEPPGERDEQPVVTPFPTRIEEARGAAAPVARSEFPEPPRFLISNSHRNSVDEQTDMHRSGSLGRFVRRLLSFGDGPIAETQLNLRNAGDSPMWNSVDPEHGNSQVAEVRSTEVPTAEVKSEPLAADQQNAPVVPESADIEVDEASNENAQVAAEPMAMQEGPVIAGPITRIEYPAEAEVPNPWAWLMPEDIAYPRTDATEPNRHPHSIAGSEQPDIKAREPADEKAGVAQGSGPIEQASVIAEEVTRVEPSAKTPAQSQQDVPVTPRSPGVSEMNDSKNVIANQGGTADINAAKRVILSMGGKGGVGKTSVMTGLAEWFDANQIPVNLLDLDTENKAKGSLSHFFEGRVPKIDIHTPAGLDAFVDLLAEDAPAILADMGAGAGKVTHDWFDKMYPDVAEAGVVFTAIGVVTSDPASVESVVNWSAALQDRVAYVIVENCLTEHADFSYWQGNDLAEEFRKRFRPEIIRMDYRLADLENAARNYGVTLGRVASRSVAAPELQKASLVMRAQSYRRRMFAEFDKVKELLLP